MSSSTIEYAKGIMPTHRQAGGRRRVLAVCARAARQAKWRPPPPSPCALPTDQGRHGGRGGGQCRCTGSCRRYRGLSARCSPFFITSQSTVAPHPVRLDKFEVSVRSPSSRLFDSSWSASQPSTDYSRGDTPTRKQFIDTSYSPSQLTGAEAPANLWIADGVRSSVVLSTPSLIAHSAVRLDDMQYFGSPPLLHSL